MYYFEHVKHLKWVRLERETYYANRKKSRDRPDKYVSITIDAADQADFHLPHWAEHDKDEASAFKVKTHVVGALMHGHAPKAFISGNQCKQGHNVTIQAFWECLVTLHKGKYGIPPTIFLQLDNTTKQNKGKYLVAFCELLVSLKVCKEIKINFLPVGHTHEDIDQFFSRLAILLRRTDALSLPHLAQIIPASYKTKEAQRPVVHIWNSLGNISEWLKINDVKKIPNITQYRSFHISEGSNGRPQVRVKTNMNNLGKDDEYRGPAQDNQPYPEESCSCWSAKKPLPNLLQAALSGTIPPSQPADVDQERLKKHVEGLKKLNKLSSALYPMEHKISNQALLSMELKLVRMPFQWDLEAMRQILTPPEVEDEPEEPEPEFQPPNCDIEIGKYYLIKPSAEPGLIHPKDNYPFYLGLIKGVSSTDANNNKTGYRVQWLEAATRCNGKTFNTLEQFTEIAYQTRGTDGRPAKDYNEVPYENILQEIYMTGANAKIGNKRKKSCTKLSIHVKGNYGRRAAAAWGVKYGKGRNVNENFGDYVIDDVDM
jgi:hypothetical protein